MGRAVFARADFFRAGRALACELGPAAVTVDAVIERIGSPKGSFYHRFDSRDMLMGELWLQAVLDYQQGFVKAIESGDGLAAALHVPVWSRSNPQDARLLLLYSRHDFVSGEWPEKLRKGVRDQANMFASCLKRFATEMFGSAGADPMRRATFVLAEVPVAAVKPHLQAEERPPAIVDELITTVYRSVVAKGKNSA